MSNNDKIQTTNPKYQISSKIQNSKLQIVLDFGDWDLFVIWCLEFGYFIKKKFHKFFVLTVVILILLFFGSNAALAAAPKAPIVLAPKINERILTFSPAIAGVAENNTRILIIIDDKIAGSVKTKNGKKTGSFRFVPKKPLKAGKHAVYAVAERRKERSISSIKISFNIPKDAVRSLDGVIIPLAKYRSWPVGVMIENLPQVRYGQSGLSKASVVYETLAEGGATRFLAIFDGKNIKTDKIMPVRSVRPYYAQWAREYGAVIMHAGGSPDGVWEIRRLLMTDADYLRSKTAKYFWRTDRSLSVHNLATSDKKIAQMLSDFSLDGRIPSFQSWKFKKEAVNNKRGKDQSSVSIKFGARAFDVEYKYDKAKNIYLRWNGGQIHKDANTKKQLFAKNVVIQYVPKEKVLDRKGRLEIKTTGFGRGMILQDGKFINISWKKKTPSGRTVFYYPNGKEVEFNRGAAWIEVVPAGKTVSIKK